MGILALEMLIVTRVLFVNEVFAPMINNSTLTTAMVPLMVLPLGAQMVRVMVPVRALRMAAAMVRVTVPVMVTAMVLPMGVPMAALMVRAMGAPMAAVAWVRVQFALRTYSIITGKVIVIMVSFVYQTNPIAFWVGVEPVVAFPMQIWF